MGLLQLGSGLMTLWTTSRRFFHLRAALCPNLTKFQFCDLQSPTSELSHISRVSNSSASLNCSARIWIKLSDLSQPLRLFYSGEEIGTKFQAYQGLYGRQASYQKYFFDFSFSNNGFHNICKPYSFHCKTLALG